MSDGTAIDYAHATINPLGWGCYGPTGTAEHPRRCSYCYAHRQAKRNLRTCPECRAFVPHWHPEELDKLGHWRKARRVFVCSMSDLFGVGVSATYIRLVWMEMFNLPRHTYLLLTKHPDILLAWTKMGAYSKKWPVDEIWPDWFWLGTTVTTQHDVDERTGYFVDVPAANRWLSVEPLLAPVNLQTALALPTECPKCGGVRRWDRLAGGGVDIVCPSCGRRGAWDHGVIESYTKWVAIGAQTGQDSVRPERFWIERIVDQCRAAGVPVYMKRNMASVWGPDLIQEYPKGMVQ